MNQIKGKLVDVVLIIQQAKDFDLIKPPLLITANFNGRVLETDPLTLQNSNEILATFTWEVNKRVLRKLRQLNQFLRIDCHHWNHVNNKEKFGHLLIDLRSAQIINESAKDELHFKWYKLIAVRNRKRNNNPELFVSLSLRNHEEAPVVEIVEEAVEIRPSLSSVVVRYEDDGYIQIGDDGEICENFLLELVLRTTKDLDLLLPEILVFNQNKNRYHLMVRIFGVMVRTRYFDRNLQETICVNEKILINLKSNRKVLNDFFRDERLEIGLYSGDDLLGVTVIDLMNLSNLNQRIYVNDCLFKFPSENGRVPVVNNRQPCISIEMLLLCTTVQESGDYIQNPADQQQIVSADNAKQLVLEVEGLKNESQQLTDEIGVKRDELCKLLDEIRVNSESNGEIRDRAVLVENIQQLQARIGDLEMLLQRKDEEIANLQKTESIKRQSIILLDELQNLERTYENLQKQCNFVRDHIELSSQ